MTLHVLVAEDDPDDRMLLEEAFGEAGPGVRLTFANDGQAAWDYLEAHPDQKRRLVLLDINMPRLDGHEVLARLRQQPGFQSTPVLMMSTSSAPEDIHRALTGGANTFVTKPARFSELVDFVHALVRYWDQHAVFDKSA